MEEAPALGARLRAEKEPSFSADWADQHPGGRVPRERSAGHCSLARLLSGPGGWQPGRAAGDAAETPRARSGPRLAPRSVPGGGRWLSKPPSKSVALRVSEPGSRLAALLSPEKEAKSLLGIGKSFKSLLAESEFLLSSGHASSGNFGPITRQLWGVGTNHGEERWNPSALRPSRAEPYFNAAQC